MQEANQILAAMQMSAEPVHVVNGLWQGPKGSDEDTQDTGERYKPTTAHACPANEVLCALRSAIATFGGQRHMNSPRKWQRPWGGCNLLRSATANLGFEAQHPYS